MTKPYLLILFLFLSLNIYSQTNFKPGYLIFNDGVKTNVLMRDMDWAGNPYEIKYRLTENAELQTGNLRTVQEFKVGNSKYVRHKADVDISSDKIREFSKFREPEFRQETHFFRVLVEGEANLYSLMNRGEEKFFYSVNDVKIEQLIYKKYNEGDGK